MENEERPHHAHVLVVSFPTQGHINPLLQFSKRLLSKGLKVTLAITKCFAKSTAIHTQTGPIRVQTFSDGSDDGRRKEDSIEEYFERFKMVGSQTLTELIKKQESLGDPISYVVYDSFLPWALDVAKQLNLIGAAFFTQSCAICSIYYHVQQGLLTLPVAGTVISILGMPSLAITDLPSFVSTNGLYPGALTIVVNQFSNIDKADSVLFNSFDQLEQEVVNWMEKIWPVKTIGPTMPSIYLDKRIEGDEDYGFNLFNPCTDTCINWLNMRETGFVVYISFGSLDELGDEQMKELALRLKDSNNHFLWVVRQSEKNKLPTPTLTWVRKINFLIKSSHSKQ